jgi:hypothetical protein
MPFNITSPTGPSGQSFILKGNYANLAAFNAGAGSSAGTPGDCWLLESDGSLMVYSTLEGWIDAGDIIGPQGPQGLQGAAGTNGTNGTSPNLQSVAENIVPGTTNTYTLGTPTKRWADIYIGPNTINITDTVTGNNAALNVSSGVLKIDGANQLQVGQLKFIDNTIESTTGAINIQIGLTSSNANLTLNRNTVIDPAKTLAVKKMIGTSTSQTIEIGSTSDTSTIELNRNTHIPAGKKLTFGSGTRADIDPSLAPWGKQTVCVKTVNGKNEMYWGSGASQGITGGTDYYILATFTNT